MLALHFTLESPWFDRVEWQSGETPAAVPIPLPEARTRARTRACTRTHARTQARAVHACRHAALPAPRKRKPTKRADACVPVKPGGVTEESQFVFAARGGGVLTIKGQGTAELP